VTLLITLVLPRRGINLNNKTAARATIKLIDPGLCDRSSPAFGRELPKLFLLCLVETRIEVKVGDRVVRTQLERAEPDWRLSRGHGVSSRDATLAVVRLKAPVHKPALMIRDEEPTTKGDLL
jgi:hypothetical protein